MENKKHVFSMYYVLALVLINSQLWSSSVCELVAGYNIYTSPSVTVQRGLCVHVPCLFSVPSDVRLSISTTGIWYKVFNDYGLTVAFKNNLKHYSNNGHFFLTGNVSSGDCSYSVEDSLPADEGRYFFMFEDDPVKFTYRDIQPYVNVTDLTDKPIISSTRLVDGEVATWTCKSPGRCRMIRPQITWEGPMTDIRQNMYDVPYGDGSRTFHSSITFTPRKSHNNSPLFCRVTFKPGVTTVEERTLNVKHSPSMKITMEETPCMGRGMWKLNSSLLEEVTIRQSFEDFLQSQEPLVDLCNSADTDDITAVNVTDGDSITMKCIVDSNPKASITWYKEDIEVQRTIRDRTVTLTLSNITLSDAGRYRCSANNKHGAAHRTVEIIYHSIDSHKEGGSKLLIPLATIGPICLLLVLALLVFACWRKRQKSTNSETDDTYTDLQLSGITSIYDQLKPEIPAAANVLGPDVGAAHNYENIKPNTFSK